MKEKKTQDEISQWFSTYGAITAERILGTYQIVLPPSELVVAVKSPHSFYHQLLQVPLRNVLNGIILQQAHDYHVYIQKLFIDYLLSGENSKPPEAQGAHTRESIEEERTRLVTVGEEFNQHQNAHQSLIAQSQSVLIQIAKEWQVIMEAAIKLVNTTLKNHQLESKKSVIRNALNHALVHCNLTNASEETNYSFVEYMNKILGLELHPQLKDKLVIIIPELISFTQSFQNKMRVFSDKTDQITKDSLAYRTLFYDTILRVSELIKLLPDYRIDPLQDQINRETLYFDKTIGENKE